MACWQAARVVRMVYDHIALCQHRFHIAVVIFIVGTEVALVVRADRA